MTIYAFVRRGTEKLTLPSYSWKAGSRSVVQYRIYKSPPLGPIHGHMNTVHILTPYLLKTRFKIILTSAAKSSMWNLPLGFSDKILYAFLINTMHAASSVHLILVELIALKTFGEESKL